MRAVANVDGLRRAPVAPSVERCRRLRPHQMLEDETCRKRSLP